MHPHLTRTTPVGFTKKRCVCVCVCTVHTHTHTHTNTYTYIHTYIHTCVCCKVDMVKVVLCRFIKSQLTGQSLINAFNEADEKKRKS